MSSICSEYPTYFSKITLELGQVTGLHLLAVLDFFAGLRELGLVINGKLPDHVLLVIGFMFEVGDVVFGDFLDDVVVGEGFTLLEYCALAAAHRSRFEVYLGNR